MKSLITHLGRVRDIFWRIFPISLLIMMGLGLLMTEVSENERISPSFAYLGRLIVVVSVLTWLAGLIRVIRQLRVTIATAWAAVPYHHAGPYSS